jgi:hypothetical protein
MVFINVAFCIGILHVKYLLHVSVIEPSSGILHSLDLLYLSNSLLINNPVIQSMFLQPFVVPWSLFQFLNAVHSR